MKFKDRKKLILSILICLVLVGCSINNSSKNINYNNQTNISKDNLEIFEKATKDYELTPISLLATQIVAGTNYLFLCEDNEHSLKIVVIYNDLSNNGTVEFISEFDYKKYIGKNNVDDMELVGGWNVEITDNSFRLSNDIIQDLFDEVTGNIENRKYYPIILLDKNENVYEILAFERFDNSFNHICILTINDDGVLLSTSYVTFEDLL